MSNIKDQIVTLLKQRHHSHKVALEQEKDPRSKHAIDLIARIREDSQLIDLIDSLPEEKLSDDLEEAANEYSERVSDGHNYRDLTCGFIAGAEWMRKKDVEDMYMSDNRHFLKCYEQGKVDMKVEMMKEAVNAEITVGRLPDDWSLAYNPDELHRALLKFKSGDKVKIIIVKQ